MAVLPPDPIFCLKSDMECIHSLCFLDESPSERTSTLLASTEKGFIYFWNLDTNRLITKEKLGDSIQCIHSSGPNLIVQEKDCTVKLFRCSESKYELLNESSWNGGFCKSVLFEDKLILSQDKYKIDVVDVKTWKIIKSFIPSQTDLGATMCVQNVTIDGNCHILAGFESGDILLWNFDSGKLCSHVKLRECITTLSFDSMTSRGICGNASNILQIFQIDRQFNITLKCELSLPNAGTSVAKLRPDRKIFVVGGWDGRIRLFSWKSLRQLATLDEHGRGAAISDVQFSPGRLEGAGARVFAASGGTGDGGISLWSLYN